MFCSSLPPVVCRRAHVLFTLFVLLFGFVFLHIVYPMLPVSLHCPFFIVPSFWIYNYLCNQFLSPLMLWVRISIRARCTTLCDKVCQWLATGRWFFPGPSVSFTNKTDCHDITEILLKVALNTIKQTLQYSLTFIKEHKNKKI